MQTTISLIARLVGVASLFALATGCTRMGQYDVRMSLDAPMIAGAKSARVDIVGVNVLQRESPNLRETGVRQSVAFGAGMDSSVVLPRTAEVWQVWKGRGAYYLVVFGDLPDGQARLELPLNTKAWPRAVVRGKAPIELIVHESGIECATPTKPLQ